MLYCRPILHRPSHDEEVNETNLCKLSMKMMGAWLLGNDESVQFAEQTHIVLVDHIMSQLVRNILLSRPALLPLTALSLPSLPQCQWQKLTKTSVKLLRTTDSNNRYPFGYAMLPS